MKTPNEEVLLAFLEGTLDGPAREELLDAMDADPALAERLRAAAAGLDHVRAHSVPVATPEAQPTPSRPTTAGPAPSRSVPAWWLPAAVAATLALAVPSTLFVSGGPGTGGIAPPSPPLGTGPVAAVPASASPVISAGMPSNSEASYMLVLQGRWPDAASVGAEETARRADEYWAWTSELATERILVAAGDLRWEPGERLGPNATAVQVATHELDEPEYMVGMLTLRVGSYEEALAIAQACPHLKYGGSVSVRRVGAGFVTVPGMDDWTQ